MKTGQKRAAVFAGLFFLFLLMIPPGGALAAAPAGPTAIGTPEALAAFSQAVSAGETYAGRTVVLTADIDMTGRPFTAIGVCAGQDTARTFQGTFDGDGHAITGLTVTAAPGSDSIGFFSGLYNAAVRDLTLYVTVAGDGMAAVGGLAGRAVNTAVERTAVTADVTAADWPAPADGTLAAGGLLGLAGGRTVLDRCAVRGRVGAAGSFTGPVYAGGVLGCLRSGGTGGQISNCYSTAGLYVNDRAVYVGGLAGGMLADGGYTALSNCYAASYMLIAGDELAGGFAGTADGSVIVQNAWYDADLAAGLPSGGNIPLPGLTGEGTLRMQSTGFPAVLGGPSPWTARGRTGAIPSWTSRPHRDRDPPRRLPPPKRLPPPQPCLRPTRAGPGPSPRPHRCPPRRPCPRPRHRRDRQCPGPATARPSFRG